MTPVHDPRFSASTRRQALEVEQVDGRSQWLTPLIMLVVSAAVMMGTMKFGPSAEEIELPSIVLTLLYPILLAVEVALGVVGLWVAAKLWLGGVGSLFLAVLRLAAIYSATDVLFLVTDPLGIVGWIIVMVVYLGLLAWQFEIEWTDALLLGFITWIIKVVAGGLIVMTLAGV